MCALFQTVTTANSIFESTVSVNKTVRGYYSNIPIRLAFVCLVLYYKCNHRILWSQCISYCLKSLYPNVVFFFCVEAVKVLSEIDHMCCVAHLALNL